MIHDSRITETENHMTPQEAAGRAAALLETAAGYSEHRPESSKAMTDVARAFTELGAAIAANPAMLGTFAVSDPAVGPDRLEDGR